MSKKRTILVLTICIYLTAFAGKTLSNKQISPFPPKFLPGMTKEEYKKERENWRFQRRQQRLKKSEERMKVMARQAWIRLLRINERQWRTIGPKAEKVLSLLYEKWTCSLGSGGRDAQSFHWHRHSKGNGLVSAKAPHEMTEGQKIADELVSLLEDENSRDEDIRLKIDALQQFRKNACKELSQAKQELAAVLMNPRQEAIFLIMGWID